MKRSTGKSALIALIVMSTLCVGAVAPVAAQSVGGGISVFVPWDMFQGETGSVAFEQSLETSFGFGNVVTFPIGFSYAQVYGLSGYGDETGGGDFSSDDPWFYADSIMPYLMAKVTIPAGPVYFEVFGGGAANWNFSLRPFENQIARDLRDAGVISSPGASVSVDNLDFERGLGWGWLAGAGFGVTIDQISVGLSATYRHVRHDLTLKGRAFDSAGSGTEEFDSSADGFPVEDLHLLLRGISFGIGGSFNLGGD